MPIIQFTGILYPRGITFDIRKSPRARVNAPERGSDCWVTVEIKDRVVTVNCEIDDWNAQRDFGHVWASAIDVAGAYIDLVSYLSGIGFTLILEKITEPDGKSGNIRPVVKHLKNPESNQHGFDYEKFKRLIPYILRSPIIAHALRDLIDGMRRPYVISTACGRVIDGLRHAIAPNQDRKKSWPKFTEALQLDRSYVQPIIDESIGPRHGDMTNYPPPPSLDIEQRTWIIMDRFLEYQIRGGKDPLPVDEFPVLTG